MGIIQIISQIAMLAIDTFNRISAHHEAGVGMSQGEFIKAALAQTEKNEALQLEIIAEAMRQKGEAAAANTIEANVAEIGALARQLAKHREFKAVVKSRK